VLYKEGVAEAVNIKFVWFFSYSLVLRVYVDLQ